MSLAVLCICTAMPHAWPREMEDGIAQPSWVCILFKAYASQALQEGDHVCWAEVRVARIGSVESRAQAKGAIMPVLQGKWKDKT